jgi:hypothetical protein
MNAKSMILTIAALSCASMLHAAMTGAGPKGGRLLQSEPLRAEFFVNSDRKVEVTFYDDSLQPVTPGAQDVSVTAETSAGRVALALEKSAQGFVSVDPLPAGEPYRVVVQIRSSPDARPQNFRVDLNLANCAGCSRAEYACTCEGH